MIILMVLTYLIPTVKKLINVRIERKSFRVKTQLFNYNKDTDITTLAYIDCDILFGISGCATEFITAGQPFVSYTATRINIPVALVTTKKII